MLHDALIVAGPTASGKSALALALAVELGGVVINADSMQVYGELRVLTARPSPEDEARAQHRLYGVRPAAEPGSAAWWRDAALRAMADATAAGALPIVCGGTGLYLSALVDGLADIPEPGEARAQARALLADEGAAALHARLAARDPVTARGLRPSDGQRLARAWEVLSATGRGLAEWQRGPRTPPAPYRFRLIRLDPPRDALRAAIGTRFDAMLAAGALQEARALLAKNLDPALPAMRAHGVAELSAHVRGGLTLDQARDAAVAATNRYVKRQSTWFRHRDLVDPSHARTIAARFANSAQLTESLRADLMCFIRGIG